jgi:GntR family transcriptional regulator, transcriptional repressor for pyruvate dehydrogenase complex
VKGQKLNGHLSTAGMAASVADLIRGRILRGQLKAGDDLPPEAVLMAQFDVSQPTMRSALRILQSEGLIVIRRGPGGGPRVAELDASALARQARFYLELEGADLDDLLEALQLVQPGAVALAARRRPQQQLRSLRRCVLDVESAATFREFSDASADFVLLLLEASGNKAVKLFGLVISLLIREGIHKTLDDRPEDAASDVSKFYAVRFGEVVDLIELGEEDAAAALWRAYLIASLPKVAPSIRSLRTRRGRSLRGHLPT